MTNRSTARELASDIRGIEQRIASLEAMRQPPRHAIRFDGISPGTHDVLDAYGATDHLDALIEAHRAAHDDLCDRHREAELTETVAAMFRQRGAERAETRRYLMDMLSDRSRPRHIPIVLGAPPA